MIQKALFVFESTQMSSMSDEEAYLHYQQLIMPLIQEAQQQIYQLPHHEQEAAQKEMLALVNSFDEKYNFTEEILNLSTNQDYEAACAELGRYAMRTHMPREAVHAAGTKIMQKHLANIPLYEFQESAIKLRSKYLIK